jgi:hypothetical protein
MEDRIFKTACMAPKAGTLGLDGFFQKEQVIPHSFSADYSFFS